MTSRTLKFPAENESMPWEMIFGMRRLTPLPPRAMIISRMTVPRYGPRTLNSPALCPVPAFAFFPEDPILEKYLAKKLNSAQYHVKTCKGITIINQLYQFRLGNIRTPVLSMGKNKNSHGVTLSQRNKSPCLLRALCVTIILAGCLFHRVRRRPRDLFLFGLQIIEDHLYCLIKLLIGTGIFKVRVIVNGYIRLNPDTFNYPLLPLKVIS